MRQIINLHIKVWSIWSQWSCPKKPRFSLKAFLDFLGFQVFKAFFVTKTEHVSTTQKAHEKNIPYISYERQISSERRMKNTVWKLKNKDEIDESYKSQLKFEYDVHLLNYRIKIKKTTNLNWAFEVLGL